MSEQKSTETIVNRLGKSHPAPAIGSQLPTPDHPRRKLSRRQLVAGALGILGAVGAALTVPKLPSPDPIAPKPESEKLSEEQKDFIRMRDFLYKYLHTEKNPDFFNPLKTILEQNNYQSNPNQKAITYTRTRKNTMIYESGKDITAPRDIVEVKFQHPNNLTNHPTNMTFQMTIDPDTNKINVFHLNLFLDEEGTIKIDTTYKKPVNPPNEAALKSNIGEVIKHKFEKWEVINPGQPSYEAIRSWEPDGNPERHGVGLSREAGQLSYQVSFDLTKSK